MRWWPFSRRRDDALPEADRATLLDALPGLAWLDDAQRHTLLRIAAQLLADKDWQAAGGLTLEPSMAWRIAALAALPLLGLDTGWYRGFYSFVVYPDDFLVERDEEDEFGIVHRVHRPLSGETAQQGAVILAWTAVQESGLGEGFNVVVHELAHKLDMLGGEASGCPALGNPAWAQDWQRDFAALMAALLAAEARGDDLPIDPYAASDPVECFAVCSEYFFDAPAYLAEVAPEIYRHLARFYRLDPARLYPEPLSPKATS